MLANKKEGIINVNAIGLKKQELQKRFWSSHYTNQPNLLLLIQRYRKNRF